MNIGGYDEASFNEAIGINFLEQLFLQTRLFMPYFNSKDKIPNTDGHFEILRENNGKMVPFGRFEVQIKTLNHDYKNNNIKAKSQYKYSCDTKIFNVVKSGLSLNPSILFLVDVNRNIVFYKYINVNYILELGISKEKSKTIFFNDSDQIGNLNDFYGILTRIHEECLRKQRDLNQNKFTVSTPLSTNELSQLQTEFDFLNNLFDNELNILKTYLLLDAWKLGIAYIKKDRYTSVGIYLIFKGKNGEFFQRYSDTNNNYFFSVLYSGDKTLHQLILEFIKHVFEQACKHKILPGSILPDEALFEIVFIFLDKLAKNDILLKDSNGNFYFKNVESVENVKKYYLALYDYSYNVLKDIINLRNFDGIVYADPLNDGDVHSVFKVNELNSYFHSKNVHDCRDTHIKLRGKYEYDLLSIAISELEKRNIEEVRRIWIPKNYKKSLKNIWIENVYKTENGYCFEDFDANLQIFLDSIVKSYLYLIGNSSYSKLLKINYNLYLERKKGCFILSLIAIKSNELLIEFGENTLQKATNSDYLFKSSMVASRLFDESYVLILFILYFYYSRISLNLCIEKFDVYKVTDNLEFLTFAKLFVKITSCN